MSIAVEVDSGVDELEAHVQSALSGRVRRLRLVLQDAGLVLHGQTCTYYAKQLAQQIVMKSTALPILSNDIEVV
jgi:hypothetical protein